MLQEFVQSVSNFVDSALQNVHTAMPGRILEYDAEKGLAIVLPDIQFRKPDGETMDYPYITGVPVLFQQGMNQEATVAFPIKPGDSCLIVVSEQSIDRWMYGQETPTDLAFDLTNAVCIPGLFVKANQTVKDACDKNAVIADVKGTRMTIQDGRVQIDAKEIIINGNTTVNGNFTTRGGVVNLN